MTPVDSVTLLYGYYRLIAVIYVDYGLFTVADIHGYLRWRHHYLYLICPTFTYASHGYITYTCGFIAVTVGRLLLFGSHTDLPHPVTLPVVAIPDHTHVLLICLASSRLLRRIPVPRVAVADVVPFR